MRMPGCLLLISLLLGFTPAVFSAEEKKAEPTQEGQAKSAATSVRSASMLANTCAGCHGTNGYSAGETMPSLAGLDKRYFYKTMKDFQSDARPSTIMGRIARGYSDNELKAIAAFFAEQKWKDSGEEADPQKVETGRQLHTENCASCHQEGGKSSPRIAGQWRRYTYNMLHDMHSLDEPGTQPHQMRIRVQKLSQEELDALSHYYANGQE